MELIPILSTIILVATIATFLLAIGAYILYKAREKRGSEAVVQQPPTIRAELVTPADVQVGKPVTEQPVYGKQPLHPGIDWRGEKISGRQYKPEFSPRPRSFRQTEEQAKSAEEQQNVKPTQNKPFSNGRFMKYTSEGYVSPAQDKNSGAAKWR